MCEDSSQRCSSFLPSMPLLSPLSGHRPPTRAGSRAATGSLAHRTGTRIFRGSGIMGLRRRSNVPAICADKASSPIRKRRDFEKRTAERRENVVAVHPPRLARLRIERGGRPAHVAHPQSVKRADAGVNRRGKGQDRREPGQRTRGRRSRTTEYPERCLVFGAGPPRFPDPTTTTCRSSRRRSPS